MFPVRILLERATARSFGSRPSHFCFSVREALFHRRFFYTPSCHVDTRASFIPKRIACFLVSKIVCSPSRLALGNLPSPSVEPSPARAPDLESCYRQCILRCTCTNPSVSPVSPSSVLCRGLSFRTPQLETNLVYDRHGRFRVASTISHGFR